MSRRVAHRDREGAQAFFGLLIVVGETLAGTLIAVVALTMAMTPLLMLVNERLVQPRFGTRAYTRGESLLGSVAANKAKGPRQMALMATKPATRSPSPVK